MPTYAKASVGEARLLRLLADSAGAAQARRSLGEGGHPLTLTTVCSSSPKT